ncbi:hypothetical protein [Pedobacter sp. ASV28]|uniref:hypothetical protein n=1 Tax=Pedobacter sp. ASV28 TaxID=2795123 RepID=UPI0018EDF1F3|nr:hypothetical protein [Pedobacter sp. ASV28]
MQLQCCNIQDPVVIATYLAFKNRRWPRWLEILAIGLAVLGTFLLVKHGDIGTLSILEQLSLWA